MSAVRRTVSVTKAAGTRTAVWHSKDFVYRIKKRKKAEILMKAVIQRVFGATLSGGGETVSQIG
mgnify:CR=1 FL=1